MPDRFTNIALIDIDPAPDNLRSELTDIDELARSIKAVGLLEPIRVEKRDGRYRILAGHRRVEAFSRLRRSDPAYAEIPAIVTKQVDDAERQVLMLVENLQRVDLDPLEQGKGVLTLLDTHNWNAKQIAEHLGVSPSWVKDRAAIMALPQFCKDAINEGELTLTWAVKLANLEADSLATLTKSGKVPNTYDIDTLERRDKERRGAVALVNKFRKSGLFVITPKEAERISQSELGDLSGDDMSIWMLIHPSDDQPIKRHRIGFHFSVIAVEKYVAKLNGKQHVLVCNTEARSIQWEHWSRVTVEDAATADDEDDDEYDDEYDGTPAEMAYDAEVSAVYAAHDKATAQWRAGRIDGLRELVERAKPAELTKLVLADICSRVPPFERPTNSDTISTYFGMQLDEVTQHANSSAGALATVAFITRFSGRWEHAIELLGGEVTEQPKRPPIPDWETWLELHPEMKEDDDHDNQ